MNKQHYYFNLIPRLPTFAQDITQEEKALMEAHGAYFQQQFDAGKLLLYGPVMAPDGAFGVKSWRSQTRPRPGSSATMIPRSALS